jgi:long-chain acyl-CoA synthetase
MSSDSPRPRIPVGEAFAGRSILLLGGTGFLGKVCLGMLLEFFPEIRRVYLMVRAAGDAESRVRFRDIVENSPALSPLRERHGAGLKDFLDEKVVVLGGDITSDNLGYAEQRAAEIAADIDLVLNCSGRVTFNPSLEAALQTNVHGTRNTIAFARRMKRPALVHISTCFVAGMRSGEVREDEPLIGYFPRRDREDQEFSVEKEIEDCERLAVRVRDEAEDKSRVDAFQEAARKRFAEEGRDPDDARSLSLAIARERKEWIRRRLRDLGIEKAQGWGWPNIYTYTKSLGDQLVAGAEGVVRTIVRPAVVESALSFPHTGWNEGFTTSAPLVRMALRGQNLFPVGPGVVLDIVPVDLVASATLAAAAETIVSEPHLVYQVASGDRNPARVERLVDLVGIYKRRHFRDKPTGVKLWNEALARMEAQAVRADRFEKHTLKWMRESASALSGVLERAGDEPIGPLVGVVEALQRNVESFGDFVTQGERQYHTFRPFIAGEEFIFRADNTRDLFSRLDGNEGKLFFNPEEIDWYDYWLHVHLPGLERWVFPALEDLERGQRRAQRRAYTYRTINELFEACTKNHAGRVAMRITRDGREERYTYADLRECVVRGAAFLTAQGLGAGDHIGLIGENSPEWGMAYFAIQRIGATAIPLERDLRREEIRRLLRLGDARAVLMSDALHEQHAGLAAENGAVAPVTAHPFRDVFALGEEEEEEGKGDSPKPARTSPTALASILFTSGTTGTPKGVMLTHRNFTSLVAKLLAIYDIGEKDGALSILPLHHSFEFTTGFLLPLSRGAQIAYLDEIGPEAINTELQKGHTTCIVGVPALWDLLRRRILAPFAERSQRAEDLATALIDAAHLLREDTGVNIGPAVFLPVHTALGGRIRYLISGASALSESTWKTFRGLGFHIAQGYGLTEAAPVLTVTPPNGPVPIGSVGKALPGIEVRIVNPDASGVGEVAAKGPNVMAGYYGNDEATAEALRDGWLYTGDLGRLDTEGHLFLVGRRKDVIVDSGGKNIYPDEVEEIYGAADLIAEIAVVGLPEGMAEQVAAVIVPKEKTPEGRQRVEAHLRSVSSRLPLHKRIKAVEFSDEALPRTATRKVKRAELVGWLRDRRREAAVESEDEALSGSRILELIASICERPVAEIKASSSFAELGFDSLMYNELAAGLESEFGESAAPEALANMSTIDELVLAMRSPQAGAKGRRPRRGDSRKRREQDEIEIPPAVARTGRQALTEVQRWFYHQVLEPTFTGRAQVPNHTNYLVVANHSSHLDMGLVKMALGEGGSNLVALAAADYFFDNRVKRTFFGNFTNLVPMERRGSLRESLDRAAGYLNQGYSVLVFPEGTRSRSGQIQKFRRGFAHLAYRCRIGVLPMHLNTWGAFPPGAVGLRSRAVAARIGPFLSHDFLLRFTAGGVRAAVAEGRVTELVQTIVERLGRQEPIQLEQEAARILGDAAPPAGETPRPGGSPEGDRMPDATPVA